MVGFTFWEASRVFGKTHWRETRKGWRMGVLLCQVREAEPSPPGNGGISSRHLPPQPGGKPWINPSADAGLVRPQLCHVGLWAGVLPPRPSVSSSAA